MENLIRFNGNFLVFSNIFGIFFNIMPGIKRVVFFNRGAREYPVAYLVVRGFQGWVLYCSSGGGNLFFNLVVQFLL